MELVSSAGRGRATKVVVATSVMLSFISYWRAAAIVLNDLGFSAYYVGGIAEQAMGRASPWFVLAFGHSFLAMSGEESLAQVNRELEYPKHTNLMKTRAALHPL
jgi:hypothetical protein